MLKRAIASVLAQSLEDFELLILDNSSTDDTEAVARSFSDSRIRYIKHPLAGISKARNIGITESKADYIAFLDDDDEWLPEKLEKQYRIFDVDALGKVGFVYGGYIHIEEETGRVFETITPKLEGNVYEYAVRHRDTLTGAASNPMLRKSAILAVGGYDEEVRTGEDYEMFLRLARDYEFRLVKDALLKIYVHRGYRLSHQLEPYLKTDLIVYGKHKDFIKRFPGTHSRFLQIIAGKCLRLGRGEEARKYLKEAFAVYPQNPGVWLQFVLSFFPKGIYKFFHRIAVFLYLRIRHSVYYE